MDGVLLTDFKVNSMSVDLSALEDSTLQAREYYIVTCVCGYPMGAGITQKIRVDHADQSIDWTVRGLGEERTYSFDPQAYRSAVQDGFEQLKQLRAGNDLETSPDINKFTYGKYVS